MPDPLQDPRVAAARQRLATVERVRERNADPTAEATSTTTASMRIDGRIDSDGDPWGISATEVSDALDALPDGTARLDVHINSRGGDAFEGLAILNRLRQAPVEVHTHVDGIAASAASAIAMAGQTLTMAPSSTLMVHDAGGVGIGQAADMRVLADALDVVSDLYADAYAARAGGTREQWRALMQPETWYRADEAVTAGLADSIATTAPQQPTASYDLSIFAYAGRDAAPTPPLTTATEAPAEPPVTPPTEHEEDGAMPDTLTEGLRERLGVADDADEATILAALDEALAEQTDQPDPTPAPALPAGHVSINADALEELRIAARAGAEARAQQLREDRDGTINAAIRGGHIAPARRDHWTAAWDADPEGVRATIAELSTGEPLFPVGAAPGTAGSEHDVNAYTDEMAAEDAAVFGLDAKELAR